MPKSHVGMGYQLCPICYEKHDKVVLLDRRLKDPLEPESFTGFSLCPKHAAMQEEYVALVECSNSNVSGNLKPQDAKPTGAYAHIRRTVTDQVFNVPIPADIPFVYCEAGVIGKLKQFEGH